MIKRALLCGLGKIYKKVGLDELPLELDLECLIKRLNVTGLSNDWESIDVIDDSPKSVFNGEKNKVAMSYDLMASKENIKRSLNEIVLKGADLILFYFSGHGNKLGTRFFMLTYDESYFNGVSLLNSQRNKVFFEDKDYSQVFNDLLSNNKNLMIISIIDCCFSACIIDRIKNDNNFLDRHIILCSSKNEARTNTTLGSFFTESLVTSAGVSNDYITFQANLLRMMSTAQSPSLYINDLLNNHSLQF